MPRNIVSLYLQLLTCGILINSSLAIIGKSVRTVATTEFKFVVAIGKKSENLDNHKKRISFCTGTLISKKSVLTAAHCMIGQNVSDVQVYVGDRRLNDASFYHVERWITYDEWKYGSECAPSLSDIAIIILQGTGVHEVYNRPVVLSTPYADQLINQLVTSGDPNKLIDNKVFIAGWGKSISGEMPKTLRRGTTTILTRDHCNERVAVVRGEPYSVPPNYFCSAASPWVLTTDGDGGAPITDRSHRLVGINIGIIPLPPGRWLNILDTETLRSTQVNTHLSLQHYRDFIQTFT